ncbi:hypothetical protein TWF481_001492 [Arthrobotrys musiformis]|uniref:Uncharacterized protein n=1 Tax=Arthrobotrys musiformis TaxID=47236 RepID=A0AAV9WQR5_9PEZI
MRVAGFAPLALLFFAPFVGARRGGGGGSDGSGGGDGGGTSGGSGGSSDTTNRCFDSRGYQQEEIYDGPMFSGYYDGQLTFKYRLTKSSSTSETTEYSCISADNQYHTFTYDAVMNIGATATNGILDLLFWELRAFTPWDRGSAGDIAPLREVFRLSSLGYPDLRITYPNGTVADHVTSREISWVTDITPVRNSTGNITSVNIDTDFVYTPLSDYGLAPATNNWVPLEDVCTTGFHIESSQYDSATFFPRGRNETATGALLTIWLQPNVSDMSANITGVGTDTVNFNLLNGKFQNLIGGAQPEWPCYLSGGLIFNDPPAGWEPFIKGKSSLTRESYWNASGDFQVSFEGALNISASKPITGYNESADALPQWKISGGPHAFRPMLTSAGIFCLVLASTMIF